MPTQQGTRLRLPAGLRRLPGPGPLAAAALTLAGLLAVLAGATGLPEVSPQQAALFEGQGDVLVQGLADSVHSFPGGWEARLHRNGTALAVKGTAAPPFKDGDWVRAQGRIARSGGRLALLADQVEATTPAGGRASPGWDSLAQDPGAWDHRPLRISGWVDHGELRDHDGHSVRLAAGRWHTGAATILGYLAYDPGCLCHRLHGEDDPEVPGAPADP